jgi:hypothetical protein
MYAIPDGADPSKHVDELRAAFYSARLGDLCREAGDLDLNVLRRAGEIVRSSVFRTPK